MKLSINIGSVVMTYFGNVFFRKLFNNFVLGRVYHKLNRRKKRVGYNLSTHLMNDLGFDRAGNPTQWSTFNKTYPVTSDSGSMKTERTGRCSWATSHKSPEYVCDTSST